MVDVIHIILIYVYNVYKDIIYIMEYVIDVYKDV